MFIESAVFKRKRVDFGSLLDFGFVEGADGYDYTENILDGTFEVQVHIGLDGSVESRVVDKDLGEEYTVIYVKHTVGNFIGQVREAYFSVLQRLAKACFISQPFRSRQMNRMAKRIADTWGDQTDAPFSKYPNYLSYRVIGKWYALIFPLKLEKLGFSGEKANQEAEVVNLKVDPAEMEKLLKKDGIYPSYHMSKKTWVSVVLDDQLTDEELWNLLVKSRLLTHPNPLAAVDGPDFWLIPANPKYYDVDAGFAESNTMTWHKKASMKKGDYVGIYMTHPIRALRYFCRIVEVDKADQKVMTIELLRTFTDQQFGIETLKRYGVSTVRGARRMTKSLIEALQNEMPEIR